MESSLNYPASETKTEMVDLLPWRQQAIDSLTKNSVMSTLMV